MLKTPAHQPRRAKSHAILVGIALLLMGMFAGHASGVDVVIDGNPLRIQSDEYLRMKVFRNQAGTFVRQYFGTYDTYLRLPIGPLGDRTVNISSSNGGGSSAFTPVTHTAPDLSTIATTVSTADMVTIAHTVTYSAGAEIYRHQWVVTNGGTTTYSDVALRYGGDTYFGGSDSASGYYDTNLGMVFCKNPNLSGLMGMFGGPESPADGYYETYYGTVVSALAGALDLPNTVDATFVDNGMGLEWRRASLAPNDSWTIIAYEKWTESGAIQVIAPAPLSADPGQPVTITFTVTNLQATADTVELAATAPAGWVTGVASSVQVPALTSVPVPVTVAISTDATGVGQVQLTLTKRDPQTNAVVFTYSDHVNVTVNGTTTVPPVVVVPTSSVPLSSGDQVIYAAISPATAQGATSVLSALAGLSNTQTRAFAWDNLIQSYVELPSQYPTGGVVPATGIFIATRQPLNYNLSGSPTAATFSLTVRHSGWTFAGIPPIELTPGSYESTFAWPYPIGTPTGTPLQITFNADASIADAMGAPGGTPESSRPWYWNGTAYAQVDSLEVGKGYWFKNNLSEDITITISVQNPQASQLALQENAAAKSASKDRAPVSVRDQGTPPPPPPGSSQAQASSSSGSGCGLGSGVASFALLLLMAACFRLLRVSRR